MQAKHYREIQLQHEQNMTAKQSEIKLEVAKVQREIDATILTPPKLQYFIQALHNNTKFVDFSSFIQMNKLIPIHFCFTCRKIRKLYKMCYLIIYF